MKKRELQELRRKLKRRLGKKLDKLEEEFRKKGISEAEFLKAIADVVGVKEDIPETFSEHYIFFGGGDVGSYSMFFGDHFRNNRS